MGITEWIETIADNAKSGAISALFGLFAVVVFEVLVRVGILPLPEEWIKHLKAKFENRIIWGVAVFIAGTFVAWKIGPVI